MEKRKGSNSPLAESNNSPRTSTSSPPSPSEQNVFDRAFAGGISATEYKSFVLDFIRDQNSVNLKTTECSLSKNVLDWGLKGSLCPVVDLDEEKYCTDTVTIFNNSKSKKVYFDLVQNPNPKANVVISPSSGSIKKNSSVEVSIKMRVFCTTKLHQMVKFTFSHSPKGKKPSFFGKKANEDEIGHLYLGFKIESELSTSIDYDEIIFGDQLAKGGFGTVYKSTWREAEVAVKVLNVQDLVDEEREMVRREIKMMSKLNYSYIVTYMGSTQVPGSPICIVMEYIRGGTLSDLIKHRITDRFKCKLSLDVAKGMAYLHGHNIFHRDIKPDNMLVVSSHPDAHVNLKITDFGTSRASTYSAAKLSDPTYQAVGPSSGDGYSKTPTTMKESPGGFQRRLTKGVGTLIYQAQEIIEGRTDFTIDKTDIFSFGVLLLEVFSQKEPYSDPPFNKWGKWDIEKFVSAGKRLPIPSTVPPKVSALIERCWHATPTERPEFPHIVKILTEVMDSCPPDTGSSVIMTPSPSSPAPASDIPIPTGGPLSQLGWTGDIGRSESEVKLKGCAVGTFLLRWSRNTASYVLSYLGKEGYVHIAYIMPLPDGKIGVDKEDGKKARYDNLFDYVEAMKESKVITHPLRIEAAAEALYGMTPSRG